MGKEKDKQTTWQKLCAIVPIKKAYFIKWYCMSKDDRKAWEEYSESFLGGIKLDTAMDYLYDEDVQNGIKFWMGMQHTQKLINIYNKQYEKALEGDVQSAKFMVDFGKTDFFDKKTNKLIKLIKNIQGLDTEQGKDDKNE